jgi:hypothetical protein
MADGAPKMFFVCVNMITHEKHVVFVGANQADWEGLPAIARIRRADRDLRLAKYIPLAKKAYDALYQTEQMITLPSSMASLNPNRRLYETRG